MCLANAVSCKYDLNRKIAYHIILFIHNLKTAFFKKKIVFFTLVSNNAKVSCIKMPRSHVAI